MLVLALSAAFLVAVSQSVVWGLRVVRTWHQREELRGQLVAVLDRLTRDAWAANDVDEATDDRFQFDTPSANNNDYDYDGTTDILQHDSSATTQMTLLRYATSWDFDYYDSTGAQLTTPVAGAAEDTIRVVQVMVTVSRNNETLSMAAAAYLRNM